jgi:RNA polymerase sigma-70 factor (ECF subfamily)
LRTPGSQYGATTDALLVGLARTGDRAAFAELVARRQVWIRNLMRRCCGDATLADDLSQQAFLQAWRHIGRLQEPGRFAAWLKRIAINAWLQQLRSNDPLRHAADADELEHGRDASPGIGIDLDRALATLAEPVRLCVVLSYHEGMTHAEIADMTGLPLGTVKSHIRRGSDRLRELLSSYIDDSPEGATYEQ